MVMVFVNGYMQNNNIEIGFCRRIQHYFIFFITIRFKIGIYVGFWKFACQQVCMPMAEN